MRRQGHYIDTNLVLARARRVAHESNGGVQKEEPAYVARIMAENAAWLVFVEKALDATTYDDFDGALGQAIQGLGVNRFTSEGASLCYQFTERLALVLLDLPES